MAAVISFVASTAVENVNATATRTVAQHTTSAGAALTTGGIVAGNAAIGDTIIVIVNKGSAAASNPTAPTAGTNVTTFSQIGTVVFGNDSDDCNISVFSARINSTPAADSTVLYTLAASGNASFNQSNIGFILRNVDRPQTSNNTRGGLQTYANGGNTSVPDPASITPYRGKSWILVAGGGGLNAAITAYTIPSGLDTTTNLWRVSNNSASGTQRCNLGAGFVTDWTSGASDIGAFGGGTVTGRASWGAVCCTIVPFGGRVKVYNGATWDQKLLKRWQAVSWVQATMVYYNSNGVWETAGTESYV